MIQEEKKLPDELEKEIATWIPSHLKCEKDPDLKKALIKWAGFIARHFAEWQKAKMLERAVEGKVAERIQGKLYARCPIPDTMGVEFCDKVRVIFIKED